jgi:WhiB family redox-sensing transcriptional regulator
MKYKLRNDAFVDALKLADISQEKAGGNTPCTQFPDAWFPDGNRGQSAYDERSAMNMVAEAKRMCLTACPILLECREYALKHAEPDGVWGGMTPNERKIALGRPNSRGRPRTKNIVRP